MKYENHHSFKLEWEGKAYEGRVCQVAHSDDPTSAVCPHCGNFEEHVIELEVIQFGFDVDTHMLVMACGECRAWIARFYKLEIQF